MQEASRIGMRRAAGDVTGAGFVCAVLAFCVLAAFAIGAFPLQASIVTIFLFAGLHSFMEFRYFLARMPVRWGRSARFYAFGIGGAVVLTAGYLSIYFLGGTWLWSAVGWKTTVSFWNTLFVLWVGALFYLRGRQKPGADWTPAIAAALFIAGVAWLAPAFFSLSLVYLHPLVALWFLDRQIRRTRPEWLKPFRYSLLAVPVLIAFLWAGLSSVPDLPTDDSLFRTIVLHAGGGLVPGLSTHFLVAAHVFLETLHYAAWIVVIPLVDRRAIPWRLSSIPLFANQSGYPKLVAAGLSASAFLVILLWTGFSIDYSTTRDIYFAFAIAHVLAEFPFLVKML